MLDLCGEIENRSRMGKRSISGAKKNSDRSGDLPGKITNDQIQFSVVIEICGAERKEMRGLLTEAERSIAVVQVNCQSLADGGRGSQLRDRQVDMPVAVEIAWVDGDWIAPGRE